jgi:anti-anti-sigma factor
MSTNPPAVPAALLKSQIASAEDTTLVHCRGRLTADVAASFKEQVKGLRPGAKWLVLDLSEVTYMHSSGLGALVSVHVSTMRAGCDLQLINLTQRIRILLGMTHLLSVFETTDQDFIRMPGGG